MPHTGQLAFLKTTEAPDHQDDWTFNGASTRELTHCYHDYPARMIPQVAAKLIHLFGGGAQLLFDPYCGTGTSLVEGTLRGIAVIGTDLNPLARLIALAKTSTPDLRSVDRKINELNTWILSYTPSPHKALPTIHGINRLGFWFKEKVIEKLYELREFIGSIEDPEVKRFFQVAFSETVRDSSNTRNEEFKLYRYNPEKLAAFDPDVFGIMALKLQRNRHGLKNYAEVLSESAHLPIATVHDFNTVEGIPPHIIKPASVDIVVTSPPYGDSHTTVAYGQYSRFSAAWLELEEPDKIDRNLMGGTLARPCSSVPGRDLNSAIERINSADNKRGKEVAAFYYDLYASIKNVATTVKPGGHACYVLGNRKVKGVVLPTDVAVRDFFENCGFTHVRTFTRSIPNKRMPLKNSPSNATGILDDTMSREYIVVMRRTSYLPQQHF